MWPDPFDYDLSDGTDFTTLDAVVMGVGILLELYAIVHIFWMEKKLTQPDMRKEKINNNCSIRVFPFEMTVTEYQIIKLKKSAKSNEIVKTPMKKDNPAEYKSIQIDKTTVFYKSNEFDKSTEFDKTTVFDDYTELNELLEVKC